MTIQEQIDNLFDEHCKQICHSEAEKYFGKYYWGLTISRCSEEEFIKWWNKNKEIPYNNYFYELACYIWNKQA